MIIEKTENGVYKMLDLSELPKRKYGDSETIKWKGFNRYTVPFTYGDFKGRLNISLMYTTKNWRRVLKVEYQGDFHMITFDRLKEIGDSFKQIILTDLPECLNNFPEIVEMMSCPQLAKTLTKGSSKKIEVSCLHCGTKHVKTINNLFRLGFRCSKCDTNSTYNEQLMETYLKENNIKYVSQYKPKNFHRVFDFFLPDKNIFIETHGLQHYREVKNMGDTAFSRSQNSDREKRDYCLKSGAHLIEIDCSSGQPFEIIKQINSTIKYHSLPECDKEIIIKTHKLAKRNYRMLVEGYMDGLSLHELHKKSNINKNHINCILRRYGVEARGWGTQIVLINCKTVFSNVMEASRFANCSDSLIHQNLKGKVNFAGKHPVTGEKLGWVEYDTYKEKYGNAGIKYFNESDIINATTVVPTDAFTKSREEIIKRYNQGESIIDLSKSFDTHYVIIRKILKENNQYEKRGNRRRRIVNVNSKKIFDSLNRAANFCGLKNTSGISNVARGVSDYAGKHPITGEPLKWMYYEDYIEKYGTEGLTEYIEEPEKQTN